MVNGTTEAIALHVAAVCISLFVYLHISVFERPPLQNIRLQTAEVLLELALHTKTFVCLLELLDHYSSTGNSSDGFVWTPGTYHCKDNLQSFVLMFHCEVYGLRFNARWDALRDLHVCLCVLQLMCLFAGVREYSCQQRLFFSFLLPRRCNHILAPSQWQLVGMHIVIKQFPVCKCPVYTSLLQSLSLDRLLEYEESSYTMKNENSKTSIKK